ncbi:hypothetical protein ES319_D09G058300v1 [Gossypium barbadense]|uniref:Transmembrane protein n=3 Tax=Gossypium TaxID=3633 RepID=A0A5J5Q004_GOSBA|nr:hypothetical protein ES319_D09G058300v1 [Gossypium barbadense]TYG52931.1 hypothetical protein ES288_D09G068400v1 [Gossypium darwinii]TYH52935.1 hypothetical protein ES332_D09G063300v1 [Gossypium tomentosum]
MGLSSFLRPLIVFLIFIISVLAIQITPVSAELKVSTQPQGDKRMPNPPPTPARNMLNRIHLLFIITIPNGHLLLYVWHLSLQLEYGLFHYLVQRGMMIRLSFTC